jgi:hypothetical protein
MKTFYEKTLIRRPSPESQDLSHLTELFFQIRHQNFKTVFIAVDALDEIAEHTLTDVLSFFEKCSSTQSIKVIATSRPNHSQLQSFQTRPKPCQAIAADDSGVRNFLETYTDAIPSLSLAMKQAIVNQVGVGTGNV